MAGCGHGGDKIARVDNKRAAIVRYMGFHVESPSAYKSTSSGVTKVSEENTGDS